MPQFLAPTLAVTAHAFGRQRANLRGHRVRRHGCLGGLDAGLRFLRSRNLAAASITTELTSSEIVPGSRAVCRAANTSASEGLNPPSCSQMAARSSNAAGSTSV